MHEQRSRKDHLHHDEGQQDVPGPAGDQGYLPFLFLRREDRSPGPERVRQEHPAAHHGRGGPGVRRPGRPVSGIHTRVSRAGACTGPGQDRTGGGGGRPEGDCGPGQRVQRDQREVCRAHVGRRDGGAHGAPGRAAGKDRPSGCLGRRLPARDGHGRPALPSGRHRSARAFRRREEAGGPVQASAQKARHSAPGRAHESSGRRDGRLAGASSPAV